MFNISLRSNYTLNVLFTYFHILFFFPMTICVYIIFIMFVPNYILYIHPLPALSPFNPWHSHRVFNDFLCAKVAIPYDMESTAMLFQEKFLTDAPRIFF